MTRIICCALLGVSALLAQTPEGRWEGVIETPNGDLKFVVDLKQDAEAGWIGAISVPVQKLEGFRLSNITVKDSAVGFGMKMPGDPRFEGKLAKEGGKITGELTQGGGSIPFSLTRTGEAQVQKPARNAPVSKELEGTWEGSLTVKEQKLRLRFVLSNTPGGATGTAISLDQGNAEFPIEKITQIESKVVLEIPAIRGSYTATLKDKELAGEWTQGSATFPLTLTKQSQ